MLKLMSEFNFLVVAMIHEITGRAVLWMPHGHRHDISLGLHEMTNIKKHTECKQRKNNLKIEEGIFF